MGFFTLELFVFKSRRETLQRLRKCFMSKRSSFVLMVARMARWRFLLWLFTGKEVEAFHQSEIQLLEHIPRSLKQLFVFGEKIIKTMSRDFLRKVSSQGETAEDKRRALFTSLANEDGDRSLGSFKRNRMINDLCLMRLVMNICSITLLLSV